MTELFGYTEQEMRDLILRNYPRMITYIRRLLGCQTVACEAEDLFHDALCQLLESRAEVCVAKIDAYLFKIVRNRTLNHLTRNYSDRVSLRADNSVLSAWDLLASVDYEGCAEEGVQPIDAMTINDILKYSESFSPRMREIFFMSRVEGLSHREIAERLGISVRSVERDLQHSVVEFRRFFGYDNGGAS